MSFAPTALSSFGQHLVSAGLLVEAQAHELADQARAEEMPFALYLENKRWVNASALAEATSQFFSLPLYNLDVHQADKMPLEFMSLDVVQKGFAIPLLRKKKCLFLGVADPETSNLGEIAFAAGIEIKLVIVEADKLRTLLSDMRESQTVSGLEKVVNTVLTDFDMAAAVEPAETFLTADQLDDKPVVSFINQILMEAIKVKASDIHFEPFEKYFRVRYRIDGVLHEASRAAIQTSEPLIARIKVLAHLDIAEHRMPQDGRFKINLSRNKMIDFRISTCPTIYGEKAVLRILDPDVIPLDIDSLGMENFQRDIYLKAINEPQGIILVTGPTGSGKTVSLYTALKLLNSIQKNICTVEDPIEIYMPGVNQVHMNPKAGLTFAKAMRAFLRQDPDIIMVGEIRDLDTADIAVKAAQTGHLVLSTLHTNNAPMTITRLANIGLEAYNIASSLLLIIAQRLVRKLCKHCKKPVKIEKDILLQQGFSQNDIKNIILYEAGQCKKCTNGYKGRIGIFELLPISPDLRNIILHASGDATLLSEQAKKEDMITLRQSGLNKVKTGITSLEELNRVITVQET